MVQENLINLRLAAEKYSKKAKYAVLFSAMFYGLAGLIFSIVDGSNFDQTIMFTAFFLFTGIFLGYSTQNELQEKADILSEQISLNEKFFDSLNENKSSKEIKAETKEEPKAESAVEKVKTTSRAKKGTIVPPALSQSSDDIKPKKRNSAKKLSN